MNPLKAAANVDTREAHDERAARAAMLESFMRRIIALRGRIDLGPDDIRMMDIAETALMAVRTDTGNTPPKARSVLILAPQLVTTPGEGGNGVADHDPTRPGAASEIRDGKVLPISRPAPKGTA